jgi:hypothetical protein
MGVPQGNADHCPDFPCHRPLPCRVGDVSSEKIHGGGQKGLASVRRRCLSLQRPRHFLSEPPPLSPCPIHPPLNVGAYPDRHFPPRPPGYRRAPCHRATRGDRAGAPLARARAVGSMPPRPFWPSELSGPPTHERRSPWAECEAQHRGAVLIIF